MNSAYAELRDAIAARPADAPVLVGEDSTWRAAALLDAVNELADRLAGCRSLAVLADNSPSWVIADLAALAVGITHVPLPTFFNGEQLAHVLESAGVETILTDQPERIGALDLGFAITGRWHDLIRLQRPAVARAATPVGTAKVSFTSGSTGNPKGACLTACGLLDTAKAVASRLAGIPVTRHLVTLPLSLLLENTAGIYAPLLRGAEIHLPGLASLGWQGMAGFDPRGLQQTVDRLKPETMILVPELLKAWSLLLAASTRRAAESLRFVAVGGARVDARSIALARRVGIPAYQGYGLTECGSVVSLNCPGDENAGGDDAGRPLDHVQVHVRDGEIFVSARALLGYLGDAFTFHADGQLREFPTGDLGHLDDTGHLHLSGRSKNLLITSYGRNIAPEWVEAALLAQPAIAQAVVTGDARPWLSAVIVPMPGADAEAVTIAVAAANSALPDYARVGAWVQSPPFSLQNDLATGNGRPRRSAILARYASGIDALYANTNDSDIKREETADVLL